ncbi:MAG: MFS transporter [Chloroflexota bacterium]|nr:MFS transporter [Chloroflexota bacterium]MDE2883686.1 MFS transporter [Chloroflexota bacterium]
MLQSLRAPGFLYYLPAASLGQAAALVTPLFLGWQVLELTDSTFWVGVVGGLPLPAIITLSLLGGVHSDRVGSRPVMFYAAISAGLVAGAWALVSGSGASSLYAVALVAVLLAGIHAFGLPASRSLIFELVGRERLAGALSLSALFRNSLGTAAPALAGVLVGWWSITAFFVLLVVLYCIVVSLVALLPRMHPPDTNSKGLATDLVNGIRYSLSTPRIRGFLMLGVFGAFANAYLPLIPIVVRDTLDSGAYVFGLLWTCRGVGAVAGSPVSSFLKVNGRLGLVLVVTATLYAASLVGLSFARDVYSAAAAMVTIGILTPIWLNTLTAGVQLSVASEMRGRAMSVLTVVTRSIGPLGWLIGGAAALLLDAQEALWLFAAILSGTNIVAYLSSRSLRST